MKKKILICEDDLSIAEVISIVLEEQGYCPIIHNKSESIFEIIEEEVPHLILLDIYMPNIDGFEITKILKNQERFKEIPIIIVSASNKGESISQTAGADDFLAKPFNVDDLVNIVQKYLPLP